jgi:hypothetical protein
MQETETKGGEVSDFTEETHALRSRPTIGQAGPLTADDYAEGNIGHEEMDNGRIANAIKTLSH